MSASIILTGDAALDRSLAELERKVQNKAVRKALDNSLKMVEADYKRLVPVDTGAMRDAVRRKAPKGRRRGEIVRELVLDRVLLQVLRLARTGATKARGRKAIQAAHAQQINEAFFYPAVVELGDKDTPAQRPMRAALYDNSQRIMAEFVKQLRALLAEVTRGKR